MDKGVEATENVIEGKDILLIDDVTTSTISISTAQKRLLDIGANRVICLVLGRTI